MQSFNFICFDLRNTNSEKILLHVLNLLLIDMLKAQARILNIAFKEEIVPSFSLIESLIEPEILLDEKVRSV